MRSGRRVELEERLLCTAPIQYTDTLYLVDSSVIATDRVSQCPALDIHHISVYRTVWLNTTLVPGIPGINVILVLNTTRYDPYVALPCTGLLLSAAAAAAAAAAAVFAVDLSVCSWPHCIQQLIGRCDLTKEKNLVRGHARNKGQPDWRTLKLLQPRTKKTLPIHAPQIDTARVRNIKSVQT